MVSVKVTMSHHQSETNPSIIRLPSTIIKQLNLPRMGMFRLNCSRQQVMIQPQRSGAKSSSLLIHPYTAQHLGIPDQSNWCLYFDASSQQLRLGPVLAIVVDQTSDDQPFAPLGTFLKEVMRIARSRHIFAYVVSLQDLAQAEHTVQGWRLTNLKWEKGTFPLPHVAYNRITSRRVEKSSDFQQMKHNLQQKRISFFNQTFLNKWEVYELLQNDSRLRTHLPDTRLFESAAFQQMSQSYPVLFVKPVHGSLGRGIYRISRSLNGWASTYTTLNGEISKTFSSFKGLYKYLRKRILKNRYIIQQGIPLVHFQERPIDCRALMQKNEHGQWKVTSLVGRIGPSHRFVSNVARGGEIWSLKKLFKRCQIPGSRQVRQNMLRIAQRVCDCLEAKHTNQFGELGIDLAFTKNGQIYLLEVNSKPSKTDDSVLMSGTSKGRPSVHRLMDYTLYQSQFDQK